MAYEVFTVDTITGRRSVAVKTRKDALPGDNRSDAWKIVLSNWGCSARLLGGGQTRRRLTKVFREDPTARGWGFVA